MMNKYIILKYPHAQADGLKVNYRMEHHGDLHTIECVVDQDQGKPDWLQSYKFNFVSWKRNSTYSLLFEESKYSKNLETVLFMDEVYASIMEQANYTIDQ